MNDDRSYRKFRQQVEMIEGLCIMFVVTLIISLVYAISELVKWLLT